MRRISVNLSEAQADRLARLSRLEGRSKADIVRDAVAAYEPAPTRDRDFELAACFRRTDTDPRPVSQIPEAQLT